MSVTSRNPMKVVGGHLNSGNINTDEVKITLGGGGQAATMYSGMVAPGLTGAYGAVAVGSDVVLFSGAGRLKSVLPHVAGSGVAIFFYDAGTVSSGGPFAASGHKVLGTVPRNTLTGDSPVGAISGQLTGPMAYLFDQPFQSGLAFNSRSGQPGFTVSFIPETNTQP